MLNAASLASIMAILAGLLGSMLAAAKAHVPLWAGIIFTAFGLGIGIAAGILALYVGNRLLNAKIEQKSSLVQFLWFVAYLILPLVIAFVAGVASA